MVRTLALKSATIRQPKEAVLMGKPYSIEQLQELLASLTSTSPQAQMGAVVDYAKHSNEISAKIDETPNVSKTEFVDLVVAAVIKNQEELLKKLENSKIQLIATSNDRFLINAVDVRCLNLLERNGHTVNSYNYLNSKETFEEFKITGLNNFDFFMSKMYREQHHN